MPQRIHSVLVLALIYCVASFGCSPSSEAPTGRDSAVSGAGDSSSAVASDEEAPAVELEPYDAPPLEELEASVEWVDNPMRDALAEFQEKQATEPQLASVEEALQLRNDSPEANNKILSALGRPSEDESQVDYEATVDRHSGMDLKSTNPLMISSVIEMEVLSLTGLQLLNWDWEFRPYAPSWAFESWQTSRDHMVDKFVLRDDLTWSDGTPVTAHDFVFSFQTIMHPKVVVPAVKTGTEKLRWVEAYDDRTIVIFHKEPSAAWRENLAFPIIPKHIYEDSVDDDPTLVSSPYHVKYEQSPVTCGPYEITERVRAQEIVLGRRESWFMHDGEQVREKPYVRQIRVKVIEDPNTTLLALKKGDIDEAMINADQWVTQSSGDDFYNNNTKASGLEWVEFHFCWNIETPFFSDVRVRQAMSHALDYEEMLENQFHGLYEPCNGVFHHTARFASSEPKPYQQDLNKAEDLLDAAGWVDSDYDGVRDKEINGRLVRFEFSILCPQTPNAQRVCTLLKQNLDQIGIICHVRPTEFTVLMQYNRDHKFHATMNGWGTGTDPSTLRNIFGTGEGRNYGQYSNPEIDRLFDEGEREFDEEERNAVYARIHEILYEDQPYTWLFFRSSFYGFNKDLRGYSFSPRGPYGVEPGFRSIWVPAQ